MCNCGCNHHNGGVQRDCYGNVIAVPPPPQLCLPAAPTACITTNAQLFIASDKTWQKAQGHLQPIIDPTTITVGKSAIMVGSTIVSITDGAACDDGHLVQVVATDPAKDISVIAKLVAGGTQAIHLIGAGAFGVQGQNITLRWIEALHAYVIVESYTAGGTQSAKSYYEETTLTRLVSYTIRHNLNLINPSAYLMEIRDANTGDTVDISPVLELANEIRLNPGVTEGDVKIKILAL